MNEPAEVIAHNLTQVRRRISRAAQRVGRSPEEVTLVAVTKTLPLETIRLAYGAGQRDFGENRIEELEEKIPHLPSDIRWHMIGHLQSRKARRLVGCCHLVHSVDSIKLAQRLSRHVGELEEPLSVLLEVNVGREESKYGFLPEQVIDEAATIAPLPCLQIEGVMTMAPIVADPEGARPIFCALRELRHHLVRQIPQINWRHLSMGMTDDFEVAVEEGATIVRIGRAIFGERLA